ncbi:MAG: GNAT family N-acetyltransferase [Albidovulum sp.]
MTVSLAPTLQTERLTLRGPEARDYEPIAAFFADDVRSRGFGGPQNRNEAWRWFASMIGHWVLHGYSFWILDTRAGETVGMVGIWGPEGWPEPELGWVMFENGEGKGYAYEAALAVRAHAYQNLGFTTLSSNIFPGNTRSIALAERMGAVREREYDNVTHGTEIVYRHPGPEALAS